GGRRARSAPAPPSAPVTGSRARAPTSGHCRRRASPTATRSACRLPYEPSTPTMTRGAAPPIAFPTLESAAASVSALTSSTLEPTPQGQRRRPQTAGTFDPPPGTPAAADQRPVAEYRGEGTAWRYAGERRSETRARSRPSANSVEPSNPVRRGDSDEPPHPGPARTGAEVMARSVVRPRPGR